MRMLWWRMPQTDFLSLRHHRRLDQAVFSSELDVMNTSGTHAHHRLCRRKAAVYCTRAVYSKHSAKGMRCSGAVLQEKAHCRPLVAFRGLLVTSAVQMNN